MTSEDKRTREWFKVQIVTSFRSKTAIFSDTDSFPLRVISKVTEENTVAMGVLLHCVEASHITGIIRTLTKTSTAQ